MAKFKKCLFPLHNHIFRSYHWIYELFFTDLARFQHDFLFKKSSNINEVTRAILNSFIQNFHNHKKAQCLQTNKNKNSHLFAYLRFCAFTRGSLCHLVLLVLLVCAKSFRKKNKEFKTALITSFILLLNF